MRAVRSTRLVVLFAVLVAAMALSAASASAFSVSSSTASTQAGAPTDLTFTYVATGTQTLGRLDVDLPPGVMHDPSSTPTCPVATFLTDRCPASSRVAHTATVITVAGAQVSVPGAVFHIADPADDSDFPLGIVLRPPLSALGLTGKIYLRDRVSFTNGGGLRHSITGPLSTVSVLGIPVRSRMQRMGLTFTGRNTNGNQTYNSTSCATTHLRAQATFSDGTNESRTAPYSAIGCDKLIFAGGFEFRGAPMGAPKKSFAAKLGSPARAPAGVTHEYHRVGTQIDISELGDWDTSELANEPVCTNAEFITNTCPIRSQIGTVTTGVEGFPGTKTGAIFTSHPRGAKPRGRIQLRPGVTATFTLDMVTSADGRSSLEIDGLPQLPLTDISIDVSAPVFVPKSKPASCSNREARAVIRGHNGGQTNTTAKYPPEACPPLVTTTDPADEDADGDGYADDRIRPWNFHVWTQVADGGNGVDPESARCELESPEAGRAVRGKVKVIRDTGSGYVGCEVTEADNPITVVFSIASTDGHVTVLKRSFIVDRIPTELTSEAPEIIELDSTDIALAFTFTDDLIADPQSEYDIECVIEDSSGARHTTTPGHKYIDRTLRTGGGECMWDTGRSGRFRLEIVVRDSGGHVTVLKRTAVVDTEGPVITPTDWRDQDDDGDGLPDDAIRLSKFDIPFSLGADEDVDPSSISCKLINPVAMDKGLRVADLDGDGRADVCQVTDAPGGPNTVEISAADYRGHVTVLKLAYTVDTEAPTFETTAPDKVVYDLSTFDYEFEFSDDTLTHPQSKFKAGVEIDVKLGYSSSAKIVVDRDTGRSKGFARFENVPDGTHPLTVTIEDSTGHVTVLKHSITVDAEPPVIRLTDTRDEDSDGDGMADDELRSGDFIVPFSVADEPGLSDEDIQCSVLHNNPAFQENNTAGNMPDTPGTFFCPVTSSNTEEVELAITVTGAGGHVTVLKIGFTIDTSPPVITSAPDKVVYDLTVFDYEFEFTDDTLAHRQSSFTATCQVSDGETNELISARIVTDRDSGRSKGFCRISGKSEHNYEVNLRVADSTGHVTVLKISFEIDNTGPVIRLINPEGTDADGDGTFEETRYTRSFDRAVSVQDHSDLDKSSVKCTVRGWDPTTKQAVSAVDLTGDGIPDVCRFTDLLDGLHELEVSAADVHGHVTVLKAAITVEATPPSVTILSPIMGQTFAPGSTLTTRFTAVGESPLEFVCLIDTFVVDPACSAIETFSLIGLSAGSHTFTVNVRDSRGRSSSSTTTFTISSPPPDVCVTIIPPPPGCPGTGTGPIITLP